MYRRFGKHHGELGLQLHAKQPNQQHDKDDGHGKVAEGDGDGYPQGGVGEEVGQRHSQVD